jgi:hypothetical protein
VTWWAWCLIGVVVAAFVAAAWLKRAADESWHAYQQDRMWREIYESLVVAERAAATFGGAFVSLSTDVEAFLEAVTDVLTIDYNEVAYEPVARTCWCGSPAGFRADKGFIDCLADRMHDWRGLGRKDPQ